MTRRLLAIALAAVIPLLGGCSMWGPEGGPGGAGGGTTGTPTSADGPEVQATTGPDGVQRITIQATDTLHFQPAAVRAHTGTLEITVHDAGVTPHTFTFPVPPPGIAPGAGIDNLNGGQTRTFRLTITTPGRYAFQCAYHATNGMRGVLDLR